MFVPDIPAESSPTGIVTVNSASSPAANQFGTISTVPASLLPADIVYTDAPALQIIDNGIASKVDREFLALANRYDQVTWTSDYANGFITSSVPGSLAFLDIPSVPPGSVITVIHAGIISTGDDCGGTVSLVYKDLTSASAWGVVDSSPSTSFGSGSYGDINYTLSIPAVIQPGYGYAIMFTSDCAPVDLHLLGATIDQISL